MQNYIQKGDTLSFLAPYDVASGAGFMVGGLFAVAAGAALSGAAVEGSTKGVFELAKVSAQAWAVGDPIYWNDSTKLLTNVAGDLPRVGFATEVAANPTSVGRMLIVPTNLVGAVAPSTAIADLVPITGGESPTEAEHNAMLAKINLILAALRAKQIIAD